MPIPFELTPRQVANHLGDQQDSTQPVRLVSAGNADSGVVWLVGPGLSDADVSANDFPGAFAGDSDLSVVLMMNLNDGLSVELPAWMLPFLPADSSPEAVGYRQSETAPGFHEQQGSLRDWLTGIVVSGAKLDCLFIDSDRKFEQEDLRLPALRPSEPELGQNWLRERIEGLRMDLLLPRVRSESDAVALRAGLLQVNGFLDASHQHSQSVEGQGRHAAGDYWHAIMHRREPDYSNAKYWFRRVGENPIFPELASRATALLDQSPEIAENWGERLCSGGWDSFAFVDLCQSCPVSEENGLSRFARRLQWIEMQLLLRQTWEDACGAE